MPFVQVIYMTHVMTTTSPVFWKKNYNFPQILTKLLTNSDSQFYCVIEGSAESVGEQRQEQHFIMSIF